MKIVKYLSFILVAFVIIAGLTIPLKINAQGFFEFPIIPGLEEKARNLFFHVPMAWVALLGFILAFYYGVKYLKCKDILYDIKSSAAAGLGMMFCFLATATGSLWAKFNWGSFWNWDPREIAVFILLVTYGAYFALRSAIISEEIRARLSAVYAILAGITAPFLIFILPRIYSGLHPGSKDDVSGKIPIIQLKMPINMRILLILGIIAFSLFFIYLLNLKVRTELLERKSKYNL